MESMLFTFAQSSSAAPVYFSNKNPNLSPIYLHKQLVLFRCPLKSRSTCCALQQQPNMAKEAKLWGGRFEEGVTDAVERFTESISFDKALYKHDIMGSRAHASMLAKQVLFLFIKIEM